MARPRIGGGFTISQLQSMLQSRQSQLDSLNRERTRILKTLGSVDDKIRRLGGDVPRLAGVGSVTASGRARNPKSLVGTMEDVLTTSGRPMTVGEIVTAVEESGYRSNSANFRAIVNQTLIKERKRFNNTGRGLYALK